MSTRTAVWLALFVLVLPSLAGCARVGPIAENAATTASASAGALRAFDLWLVEYRWSPQPGKTLGWLAFSLTKDGPGSVPGPEIRVTEGDHVRVTLHGADHTIHWHGYAVPWAMDGVPFVTQGIDQGSYVYEFDAKETGTYWYHCHVDAPVHVDEGLFGAFIVEPRDKSADPPFDREATLFLHEADSSWLTSNPVDTAITGGDPTPYASNVPRDPMSAANYLTSTARQESDVTGLTAGDATGTYALGSAGPRSYYPADSLRYRPQYDSFMINAKSYPYTEPLHVTSGETLRVRIVNAGQLVHTMHLHGQHMLVTHKDGYRLASPYYADTLGLFPGERYDVYIKADNPGLWDFHDHGGAWGVGAYASDDGVFPGGMGTMLIYDDFHPPVGLPAGAHMSGDYAVFARSRSGNS